jgi:S-adenosyl-L-methionine methyltransferase
MQAQRACLDCAARLISPLPRNVLEFGRGNGCTDDHLRLALPARDTYVFDRQLTARRPCALRPSDTHACGLSPTGCRRNRDVDQANPTTTMIIPKASIQIPMRLVQSMATSG